MRKILGNGMSKVFIEELNFKNVLKSLYNMLYHFGILQYNLYKIYVILYLDTCSVVCICMQILYPRVGWLVSLAIFTFYI